MALMVVVTAHYAADPDAVFQSALRFSEMPEAMRGVAIPGMEQELGAR
mgnify:FL=1